MRDEIYAYLKGGVSSLSLAGVSALAMASSVTVSTLATLAAAALSSVTAKGWKVVTTEHTLADLTSAAAVAGVFPAGVIPLGLSARVTTAVTTSGGADTFDVGITGGDTDAFGAAIAGALDTTLDEDDWTVSPISLWSASAQGVTLDADGAETFTAGAAVLLATYLAPVVPAAA